MLITTRRAKFSLAWTSGVEAAAMQPFLCGAGMFGRAVEQGVSQYRERQPETSLLLHEKNLTACVILKSSREVVGVVAMFGLLRRRVNWNGRIFELVKFSGNLWSRGGQVSKTPRETGVFVMPHPPLKRIPPALAVPVPTERREFVQSDRTSSCRPGFRSAEGKSIVTILGSCVGVCIWDAVNRIGGATHFLLPSWDGRGPRRRVTAM